MNQFTASVAQDHQMSREIAAIHGGHILRIERMEGACVVPVVEVSAKQLETVHGRQRGLQPFGRFQGAQPTKVAGNQGREQIEPDIGRRRPVGHDGLRIFLKVIGWQRMVFR